MQEKYQRPPLRYRRFGGGYRREDVEFALAELRLTLRQLDNDLESLRDKNRELEGELAAARHEIEGFRAKEHELSQTMGAALRRSAEIEESAQQRAREIVANAEESALRIRSEASRRIEDSSGQFNELLRLKDNLLDSMRAVVSDFDHAIARVELDAGPFSDFAALSAFERALAQLPNVEDVYVRRLAEDRALIELALTEAAPLLSLMRDTLPYQLEVRSANRAKIIVNVHAQSPAGTR